ncbi:unnamed protein product [Caenorhabditis sp. 36 PRJEB53466]|nr:unnamed protein product [Caenorhabditis sp. 36 PRJEB53466]
MLFELDVFPLCLKSNGDGTRLVVGCVDGTVRFYDTTGDEQFEEFWTFKTKSSIRAVDIDEKSGKVYAVTKNKALCVFDIETGKRIRCILKCHSSTPSAICTLPASALKSQQLATADESGEVRTWNLDAEEPMIRKWNEQEEEINELKVDVKTNLLATSSDGTLGAYDLRKGKFKVRSEVMHSELFGVCPTERSVYVGGEDGYVEVFKLNEYGNLLERVESGFEMGVSGIVELRTGLLGLTSQGSNRMRLLNVMPSKRLGFAGCHGDEKNDDDGIDAITISADKSTVYTMISMSRTIKKWEMEAITQKIPVLRAQDAKKKKNQKLEGFFDEMVEKKDEDSDDEPKSKKRRENDSDDSDLEGEDEEEEESGGENEEKEEEEGEDSD